MDSTNERRSHNDAIRPKLLSTQNAVYYFHQQDIIQHNDA